MIRSLRPLSVFFVLLMLVRLEPSPAWGQKPKPEPKAEPAKRQTHKVEKGPFKIEVSLKGIFEAEDMTEVALSPEAWIPEKGGTLRVLKAVQHGAAIRKGETVLWLDLERIDQVIADLKMESDLGELAYKQAEEELRVLENASLQDRASAERLKKQVDEDLRRFLDKDKAATQKRAHFYVKSAANWLAYIKEELRQLEKMYKANDLTEATEEIILKRQRDMVERAQFFFKEAEEDRDQVLQIDLPRREQSLKELAAKTALLVYKARIVVPLEMEQKRLTLEKLKTQRAKSAERLHKLRKDREGLTLKAPQDGLVYYGKCVRGQWITAGEMARKLQRGQTLMPDEVLFTIVARPVFVRAVIEEKDLHLVRDGQVGKIVPTADPDRKLAGKIQQVTYVPISAGQFECRIHLVPGKDTPRLSLPPEAFLLPGMACTVKLTPYRKTDALAVPAAAVFTEELDEDQHYVYRALKDGKHEKRPVTIGRKTASQVEIVQGVREGDELLLEKPAPSAKTKKGAS